MWLEPVPSAVPTRFPNIGGSNITDRGFIPIELLKEKGIADSIHLSVFNPLRTYFPDNFFSHLITISAIHLNAEPESLVPIIAELTE